MEQLRTGEQGELPWTEEGPQDYVHIHLRIGDQFNDQNRPSSSLDQLTMTETHTFPHGLPDWSNLEVLHRNTLPPRAAFHLFDNEADALTRDPAKSKTFSLSGTWKFSLAKSPFDAPPDFFEQNFDAQKWGTIEVPGMWQLQGYGKGPQ
jgi:beta-galactosidase